MALVSSGQISIGGTPVTEVPANSSIEAEIGGTFTTPFHITASLNDTSLRSLAGITGAGTTISLSNFYGKSSAAYFQSVFSGGGDDYTSGNMRFDASGNIYTAALFAGKPTILKFSPGGSIQWGRKLYGSYGGSAQNCAVDSSGNAFLVGYFNDTANSGAGFVAKYNSSGVLQWQRMAYTGNFVQFSGAATDSSDNVFACGYVSWGGSVTQMNDALIAKYNSSGTLQWFTSQYNTTNTSEQFLSIVADSAGNCIAVGKRDYSAYGQTDMIVTKFSSTGTSVWKKVIAGAAGVSDMSNGVAVDSSDNVYVSGQVQDVNGDGKIFLCKFASDGTLQWARKTGTASSSDNIASLGLSIDNATGDIYVNTQGYIIKYNSTGTVQYARTISSTYSVNSTASGMAVAGNIFAFGYMFQGNKGNTTAYGATVLNATGSVFRMPKDGSLTQSWSVGSPIFSPAVTVTYGTGTLTDSTTSATISTLTLNAASNVSFGTSTMTDAAASPTSYIKTF